MSSEKLKGLSRQLVGHLMTADWTPKGSLTALEWRHTRGQSYGAKYLPETVGRCLRSLEERGIIAVKACGISVQYKFIPEGELRGRYIPKSCRAVGKEETLFKPN